MPPIVQEHLSFVTVVLQNSFYKHMLHQPSCFSILLCAFATLVMPTPAANAQCEADHTIVMADYYFAPSELTIEPGETVAFINVQGTHNINGISNTLTGTSWGNPVEFFLDETIGTEEGTCMGVIQFDVPGVYNFDSSIGFQAQLGNYVVCTPVPLWRVGLSAAIPAAVRVRGTPSASRHVEGNDG